MKKRSSSEKKPAISKPDFGDILDSWESGGLLRKKEEKTKPKPAESLKKNETRRAPDDTAMDRKRFEREFSRYIDSEVCELGAPHAKDEEDDSTSGYLEYALRMKPQRTLDLHGKTRDDAERDIASFLSECARAGIVKVLIIHGKGSHSEKNPVLGETALKCVARSKYVAKHGKADPRSGGAGALWAIIADSERRKTGGEYVWESPE